MKKTGRANGVEGAEFSAAHLRTLYAVNDMLKQVVAEGLEIDVVLPRVLRLAVVELNAFSGHIIVFDEQADLQHSWLFREGRSMAHESPFLNKIVTEGLIAWVTKHQQTAVVDDTRHDRRWITHADYESTKEPWSAVCTPLIIRSRSVGAITMMKPGKGQFNEESVDLLNAIASQAASTIESARLYRESKVRAAELAALVGATAAVSSSLDLEEVLRDVATHMAHLAGTDVGALYDWDSSARLLSRRMLHVGETIDDVPDIPPELDAEDYPELVKALSSQAPVHTENSSFLHGEKPEEAPASWVLPMVAHEKIIGLAILLELSSLGSRRRLDSTLLQMLANQAAIAISNARLYEDAQRQLRVSALLSRASKVINSTLDTNEILQSLLAQMNELLFAEAISIALVDRQTNELVYEIAEGIGSNQIRGLRLPSNQGVSGWVMETAKPALVHDTAKDPRFFAGADERTGHHTRAMICAPMQVKGEVLGTLQAINPRAGRFSEEDLQLLINLANLASTALNNAQQYARTQAAEERYLSLFEDSVNPILLTDKEGAILEANRRALAFFGYSRQQLVSQPISSLHRFEDEAGTLPAFEEIGDRVETFTSRIVDVDRQATPVEVHVKQTVSGNTEVLQWIYRDISQEVELEEMRDDLMAMLVHDLQSPLGNVISSLELLRYELPPDSDPIFDSILDIASRSSRRLQTLIRSLLDITRLEAGHPISDAEFVEIDELLQDARTIVQPALDRRAVGLKVELPENLPPVFVDADMIGRVFMNLLDNASKYTPEAREITVRAKVEADGDRVLVVLSDRGPGIPMRYRDAIFEKFRRLQGDGAPQGLGLGLAFCRLAIEAHGGRIWVDDAPEGGARFSFLLPTTEFNSEPEVTP